MQIRTKIPKPLFTVLVVSLLALSADFGLAQPRASAPVKLPRIIFVQTPKIGGAVAADRFPEGSRIVLLAPEAKGKDPVSLTDGFYAAADPQVDFTGHRLLFAAQKSRGEHWQIWEMNLDGSGVRLITKCQTDCMRPAYLPGDEIAFTSVQVEAGRSQASLKVSGLDGSNPHAITFSPGNWWLETVLRDGRIVASANFPLTDSGSSGTERLLYTLRPDGTGLESLRCDHSKNVTRGEVSEMGDGSIVFSENARSLMAIKRGAPHPEKIGAGAAAYRWPSPVEDNSVVAAKKSVRAVRFQLVIVPLDPAGEGKLVYRDANLDSIEPVAVQTRVVPKKFFSNLILTSATGYFISLNSSLSMDNTRNSGAIRRVRVIAQNPAGEVALGEAPVESDGSFYVQVPANQPVRFLLLGEQDKVIREEQSWVWTRPGEQRGCTGCHGDKALAPENRWPLALKRQDPPPKLSGSTGDAHTVEGHGH